MTQKSRTAIDTLFCIFVMHEHLKKNDVMLLNPKNFNSVQEH